MSDIMERTLASIPRLLSSAVLGGGRGGQDGHPRPSLSSQGLQTLLRGVDNARCHSEEAAVVKRELARIKQQFEQPGASVGRWSEALPQIIFCSVLGYDVSFSYIYVVKLVAQGRGCDKRIGYLAATTLLSSKDEITILMMSTMVKDLQSGNMLDNIMALTAAAELVRSEYIPMVLPFVKTLLRHRQATVRAKAVYCLHAFFMCTPSLMQHTLPEVKNMLGDRDPGVLMAVVTTVASLVEHSKEEFLSLGMALVSILQQVRSYKFPAIFNYHGLPLPWLQIQLLKTLAYLGSVDDQVALALVPLLSSILRDTVAKEMMSLAILEEGLLTIATLTQAVMNQKVGNESVELGTDQGNAQLRGTTVGASEQMKTEIKKEEREESTENRNKLTVKLQSLLEEGSRCVSSFLESDALNMRYLGIKILAQLVCVNAELAIHHQKTVVRCLNDPDLIVRRQTLTLLHHMANPANVKVICSKMLEHVDCGESSLETYVIDMVFDLCSRLAPDPMWYLQTLLPLLSRCLDPVQFSAITEGMLRSFSAAVQDPQWPEFPKYLFTMMVDSVIKGKNSPKHALLFSLKILRFISLPVSEAFSVGMFLSACSEIVCSEKQDQEVMEQVVLCVQTLLLRGYLDHKTVSQWARLLLDQCDHTTDHWYLQKLRELLKLSSLSSGLSGLSRQKSPREMDFSLSFLDSSARSLSKDAQTLFKTQHPAAGLPEMGDQVVPPQQDDVTLTSPGFEDSSSVSASHDSSPVGAESAVEESASPESAPAVKQVWSKEGFMAGSEGGKLAADSGVKDSGSRERRVDDTVAKQQEEEDELARALFQGISPGVSVTTSLSSPSQVSMTTGSSLSSGSVRSSSESSAHQSLHESSSTSVPNLSSSSVNTIVSNFEPSAQPDHRPQKTASHSELPLPDLPVANRWKSLHAAHESSQGTEITESIQQTSAPAEHLLSDLGSGSSLSISDDSLENPRDQSTPESPVKQPFQSVPSSDPANPVSMDWEKTLSDYLETQMAESEESQITVEPVTGSENLYSGFELLTECTEEWEEAAEGEQEADNQQTDNGRPEADRTVYQAGVSEQQDIRHKGEEYSETDHR